MPELVRKQTVSRSTFLDLQDELRLVKDGYEFLDEKRILLAAEMLRQREKFRAASAAFKIVCTRANDALLLAAAEQGLDGLQVRPAPMLPGARLRVEERPYVGLTMLSAGFDIGELRSIRAPVRKSREVRACVQAFREVVESAAPLAAIAANLKRLVYEYRRTERRVRALENVVLPEIRQDLATMDEYLGLNEQEEVIRVRTLRTD